MNKQKLKDCKQENRVKLETPGLYKCHNRVACVSKLQTGHNYFCKQSPMYDKPETTKAKM